MDLTKDKETTLKLLEDIRKSKEYLKPSSRRYSEKEMSEVCKALEIEHHSMLSSVRQVAKSLFSKPQNEEQKKYIELQVKLNELSFTSSISEFRINNPDCWVKNERHQMSSEFRV